jgi:uncharacterized membrane protein
MSTSVTEVPIVKPAKPGGRIQSIDIVRGIVMIIMALDHTRDMVHLTSVSDQPTNLQTTTVALFLTRWITHFCAPTFVFLSGVSAFLFLKKNNSIADTRRYLLTRGLVLVLIEFTLVNFGVWFDPSFNTMIFDVIATIGFGFIVLALVLKLPARALIIAGLAIIFLHDLLIFLPPPGSSFGAKTAMLFFSPGAMPYGKGGLFIMGYPPIPWFGIMLTGFGAGRLFERPALIRKKLFLQIGLAAVALFIILRAINIYGDPVPWSHQKNAMFTAMSFINLTKYPPSLLFCLITLGGMFLLLYFVEGARNKATQFAIVYGKVPLFYFVIHWYIIHPIMFLIVFLQGYGFSDLVFGTSLGRPKGVSGLNLGFTYLLWIAVVIALYPICKWYGRYKEQHREKKWLSYF